MIAVTFAVPHESRDLRRGLGPAKPVILAHTGIGTAAAEKSVRALLAGNRPRWLLSAGYAGALDPSLAHGELFLATNFTFRANREVQWPKKSEDYPRSSK